MQQQKLSVMFIKKFLESNSKNICAILLFALSLTFLCFTFIRCFDNVFWGDEGYSIKLSNMGGVLLMLKETANDVHPPLYYIFAKVLYQIFGNKPIAYHLSAFLPYSFMVIFALTCIRNNFKTITALFLVTLLIFSECALRYSIEARMYALAAMFVLFAYFSLYKILSTNEVKYWCLFVISSLGAAYTHYYALLSVSFFYVALIIFSFYKKNIFKRTLFACFITVIAYLPWLFYGLLGAFLRTSDNWWLGSIPDLDTLLLFVFDYKILFAVFIFAVVSYFFKSSKKFKQNFVNHFWIFCGILSFVSTIAVGYILSYTIRPFFLERYLFPLAPVMFLIFGYCVSKLNYSSFICFVILALYVCFRAPTYYSDFNLKNFKNIHTNTFLYFVKPDQNATIFTDDNHLAWSLISYYYPHCKSVFESDLSDNFSEFKNSVKDGDWLFVREEISLNQKEQIMKNHDVKEVAHLWFANNWYYAYSVNMK